MIETQGYFARYRDLVLTLTQKELRVRYKNYTLGYVWSLAQPLAFAAVFYFAFKVALRVPTKDFVLFLLSGLFPWQWFANSVNMSPLFLLNNSSIIKKVSFPRHAVIVSSVLQDALHFLFSLPILIAVALGYGRWPTAAWLVGVPLFFVLQMAFITGISLFFATINLFFRDLERLTALMTMLLFYFTPIVYSDTQLPEHLRPYMFLNPAASFMVGWRTLFMEGRLDPRCVGWALVHTAWTLLLGVAAYRRLSPKVAEVL